MGTKRITDRDFFMCAADELAKKLIGKVLCHQIGKGDDKFVIKTRITATEAYLKDDSCLDAKVWLVVIFIFTMPQKGVVALISWPMMKMLLKACL